MVPAARKRKKIASGKKKNRENVVHLPNFNFKLPNAN